ncbi:regulatory protein RecX [Winogradskyella aurantiaca]|uniref:regulatory protein RecX n=1 Tax=Winogradskyella aurantiaca TaxID=2219558 RepID=UPI000E1DBD3C|nr:regulatory protein RecX [Winogradskyella aurantiaca]
MIKKSSFTVDEAKAKMEYYCTYQERCHKDVKDKLVQMKMIPEAIDLILVHLIERNYLNEQRFAEQFVLGKFRIKKWGRLRLKRELKYRELSEFSIKKALALISDEDYYNALDELADKRIAVVKEPHPFKRKKKVCDYLLYRGWEANLVYEIVNEKL